MARAKQIILIFALVLFSTQAVISEESQLSNTREARCNLKINCKKDTLDLDPGDMEAIIKSPSVLGKAVSDILETSPDKISGLLNNIRVTGHIEEDNYTYSTELRIALPDTVKPAAIEVIRALTENLQNSLDITYKLQRELIEEQYVKARSSFIESQNKLENLNEESAIKIISNDQYVYGDFINKQLDEKVDLYVIEPSMSFEEVLNEIAQSVIPHLQFQPNWRNLAELPQILPTTPAGMGGLTKVKVSKAIETLLEGLSTPDIELGYLYYEGVITIATKDALNVPMVTFIYDVSRLLVNGRTSGNLIKAIEETISPESWYNTDETGKGKIIDMQGGVISVYNSPQIQDKVMNFLTSIPIERSLEPAETIPPNILRKEQQELTSQKRMVELDVARLEARQKTAEQQIVALSSKIQNNASVNQLRGKLSNLENELNINNSTKSEQHPDIIKLKDQIAKTKEQISLYQKDTITKELEQLIKSLTQQVAKIQTEVATGTRSSSDLASIEEKLVQAKIQLAKRREELARPVGIESLSVLNQNLSMTILDLAEKKAELQILEKQLGEIASQLRAANTTDPEVVKYREAKKVLNEAEKKMNELKEIKDKMQPPQVITIGLE